MTMDVLPVHDRAEFRQWLQEHCLEDGECWIALSRGKPKHDGAFYYLDAVEEALCFGWIDSTSKQINGVTYQRFSPRVKRSPWTELNKERVRRLIKLGLMEKPGKKRLPNLKARFRIDPDVEAALKKARVYRKFKAFHPLYQRVRSYNVAFLKKRDPEGYQKALERLIKETKAGRTYGEWNDYGRLLDY